MGDKMLEGSGRGQHQSPLNRAHPDFRSTPPGQKLDRKHSKMDPIPLLTKCTVSSACLECNADGSNAIVNEVYCIECMCRLDLEAATKAPDIEILPTTTENNPASFDPVKEKSESDKKTTRSGGRQTKKAKVETDSQNIKEMFSRATRRKG
ncbi:hypothetical protein TEA_024286 [Camellia sinensis var. sinensis]|uniref:Uncharacterized protein n=1 Tax=Camellia sinensis var. sinensis TaxID=542762 RepID=A0A4S4EXM8_CAMSN|nr:hypothetical protein TEA_024286 [Camellia sinensis var. sinensis]